MTASLAFLLTFFPFDPAIDTREGQVHVILAYSAVWGVQGLYLAFLIYKWRALRKREDAQR